MSTHPCSVKTDLSALDVFPRMGKACALLCYAVTIASTQKREADIVTKTNAERQAAYRARRPYEGPGGNGERRVNMWVGTGAYLALERLSRRYGVTKKEVLERLILAEAEKIENGMSEEELDEYMGEIKCRI